MMSTCCWLNLTIENSSILTKPDTLIYNSLVILHMKILLIIGHGSRIQSSNQEIQSLSENIANIPEHGFDKVEYAFLELAQPSIQEALMNCINQGAKEIVIMPFFLTAGRHVKEDIPNEIEKIEKTVSGVEIQTVPYFGSSRNMADQVLNHTMESA